MPRWIQNSQTGELIPADQFKRDESDAPAIHGDLEAFVSPVDGTVIDDRAKLRAHNKRHGVTNPQDYGPEWFKRRAKEKDDERTGNTPQAKRERVELIKQTLDSVGYRR